MRLSYSSAAQFLLFFVQWTDCHLAGALGLLKILIYKVLSLPLYFVFHIRKLLSNIQSIIIYDSAEHERHYCFVVMLVNDVHVMLGLSQAYKDGKTTMSIYERKASLKEFYGKC